MNSLSGQNSQGRLSGARSSRASSTIFYKLRELDRKIQEWKNELRFRFGARAQYAQRQIDKLDKKRKELRNKRKQFATPACGSMPQLGPGLA